jgi:uncharacterized membrane protein YbjE (DUF340 family)
MSLAIVISVCSGIFFGFVFLPMEMKPLIEHASGYALNFLILTVGIELGYNRSVFHRLRVLGPKMLLIPFSIVLGSLTGGLMAAFILQREIGISLSIASGFGWYSLSGILLTRLVNAEVGAIAFLCNVFRELMAVMIIPVIAKHLNFLTSIAPAGATSMDSTLPIISKSTDSETSLISFINGFTLSALVPFLVPFFLNF